MPQLVQRQEAADRMGIHWCRLDRLRKRGLIPEAMKVGIFFVFPADQLEAIKARLVASGHITPKREPAAANA